MEKNNYGVVRTAMYIRVSTEEQAMHGLSLEAQQSALERYAQQHGYKIVGAYIDSGKTARKSLARRAELARLLSDVERGEIDLIIFTKLDRWFRNVKDYYKVQDVLEAHNVNWKTIFENYDTSTANGRLHINIMLSIAQDEADRTSERIRAVFASKIEKGEAVSPNCPIGYKMENGKIVVDPEKAQIAIDLFEHYYIHQSQRAAGITTSQAHGVYISPHSVKRMLTNPLYTGEYHGRKGFCEPLVSEEKFAAIQKIIKERNVKMTPSGYTIIFSGLITCAECGCHMSGNAQHRKSVDGRDIHYVYYRCGKHFAYGECAHDKLLSEKDIEKFLLNNIVPEINKYMMDAEAAEKRKKRSTVNRSEIYRRLERLKDLYLDDLIDKETYKRDYEELNKKLAAAETPERRRDFTPFKRFLESNFTEIYGNLDREEKRILWRGVIKEIRVTVDNEMSVVFL